MLQTTAVLYDRQKSTSEKTGSGVFICGQLRRGQMILEFLPRRGFLVTVQKVATVHKETC